MNTDTTEHKKFPLVQISIIGILVAFCIALGYLYAETRGPVADAKNEQLVIPSGMSEREALDKIEMAGYVRNPWMFERWWRQVNPSGIIKAGGYTVSKSTSMFRLVDVLMGNPLSVWVGIPEGLRKEEIVKIIGDRLDWNGLERMAFTNAYRDYGYDYIEGVYYPETYLMPVDDGGAKVAKRMIVKFNEELSKITPALANQNVKWTTALKLASLVQREAASKDDMPLIAGVLWNRLEKKQRLEVDSTIQYAKNKEPDWWAPLKAGDTNFDSPYNTYRHSGLPPTPIANPGKAALEAVANPQKTGCLFYIHDANKVIHCATTFEEHKTNIRKYL